MYTYAFNMRDKARECRAKAYSLLPTPIRALRIEHFTGFPALLRITGYAFDVSFLAALSFHADAAINTRHGHGRSSTIIALDFQQSGAVFGRARPGRPPLRKAFRACRSAADAPGWPTMFLPSVSPGQPVTATHASATML